MKMRLPLATSVALAVVCLSAAISTAQDAERGDAREKQVMERFLTVLEKSPRRGTALDRVYGYHVERGSLDALVKTYQDRTAKDPADGTSWLLLGLIEAQRGKDAAAVSAFRKAEENRPTDALAPYYLGQALVLVGQPDAAAEAFERALTKRPNRADSLEIYQALGRVHQRAHHNDLALDVWKRFEKAFPDDARVQEQIAQSLADEGQNAPALERYAVLATKARDPYRKVQFALEAAELKVRLGKATDALNDFEALLGKLEPESWLAREVRRKIEEVFLRNDDLAGLIAYYERWIKKTPDDVEAMARLGRTLANQGRAADARVWLDKAVTLAPSRRDLRLALIEQLAQDQKFADASKQYEELAKLEPNNPDVLRDWGKLLLRDTTKPEPDRKKAAAEVWKKLVGDAPKDALAVSQAADLFRQASMIDDAIALYKKAIELAPESGQYYEYLGDYYHALKRPADALAAWKGIAEGKNRTARNLGRLGEVLAGFGYKTEALQPLLDANQLDDDDFDLRLKLADLYQQLDRPDDCLKELAVAAKSAVGDEQNEAVLERQIKVELARGTLGKRIDELAAELAKGKGDVAGWTKLARYHEANQKLPEAIAAINKAIEIDPKSIPTWLTVARLREQSGDIAGAAEANRTLAGLDRRSRTDHLTNLAKLEARLGRRDAALAAGRDLLAAAPGNPEHHEYFAELCFQLGENDEGLEALRRSVRANPSEPKVMLVLGDNLAKQFRTEEAIELFWRAFDKTTDLDGKMNIVSKLADQYLQRNQVDRLIARLERELREPNQQRELSLCLAQAHASSGDIATARQELEKLLAVNTRDTQLLNQLSTLSESEGDLALASKYQRQSMDIAPNPDGLNRLAQLYLRSGEVAEAEGVWSKLAGEDRDPARVLMAVDSLLNNGKPEAAQIITERLLSKAPKDWEALYRQALALNALKKFDEADRRFQAILDLRLADNEEGAIAKARKKFGPSGSSSASNPAVRAAGTPATSRGQASPIDAVQARAQAAFNIRLITKLDPQFVYYNSMPGYQFSPGDFGQARMAAMAFRYVIARDAQKEGDFVKAVQAAATAPGADVRALWDHYYFEVVRQDTPATFEAARRLYRAARGDINAQYAYVASLNGRVKNVNQRTVAQPGSPQDKTPPLSAEDLADAVAAFKSLRQGASDQVGFHFNVIRVELERARKKPEFDALYAEEKANASTFLRTAAVLALAAERGDVPVVLELAERADRLRPKSTMPGQVDEGFTIGSWLARAMSVRADEKAHADVLKLLDVGLASLQKPENAARRAKARSGPSNVQMMQNGSVFQIYFGKNSRQVRLDYPSPNAYFDRGGVMVLRAAYEYFKRADLLSDLFQHIRKKADAAKAADKIYPTLALSYLHWWNDEKDESLRELTAASDMLKGDIELRLGLAELRAQRNEPIEALELLDTVEPLDQKTVQRKETLALRLAVMTGDVARARKAAERLFGIRIDSELQLQLVSQMNQLGMSEMAEAILGRARRRAGANTATLVSLMSQYQRQGKTDTALQIANQILRAGGARQTTVNGGDEMDYAQREAIQTISRSGKLKELIERAEKQLASSPNSMPALRSLADYYRATNDRDKLKATYERLLKARPDDAPLRFQVANQLSQIGDNEGAVAQYKAAILKEPRLYTQRYWQIQNAFQQANKMEDLINLIDQVDFKAFGTNTYVIQELIQTTAQNAKLKDLSLKLFRKAWKEMPDGRANLIANLYDDNLWRLPELYDYAREAVIPKPDATSVDPWQSISHIYSWSSDSVNGVVTRLIEAATRQNKLESLQADVRAALKAHPEWVGGKALDLIIQIRKGRIEDGRKGLQELVDKEAEIPAYAQLIIGQEVEKLDQCRPLAIALYEKATKNDESGMSDDWEFSPERRLLRLYQKDGRKDQARALVRKAMKQPDDRNGYDPNYAAYRKVNRNLSLGNSMIQLGYPVEAVQVFEDLLGDTESLQNGAMYFGSPEQILMQANRGLDMATAAIKGESLERALDSLLIANDGKNGKPALNLLARVQPKEVDNATVRCLLSDTLQAIGKDPKLRAVAVERLNSISAKHPGDLSVAISLAVLAALDADKSAFPKSLEAVEQILAARPLEDLPANTRPNARQREEAAAKLPIWLVAREALKRDDTKDRGLKLQAIAMEAARRQAENVWLLAMLRESGQSALERGDRATAEAQWRLILREILKPPAGVKAKPAQPQPGAGGPVRTVPAAPASIRPAGASLSPPGRATLVAYQQAPASRPAPAPPGVGTTQRTRVAPGARPATPGPTSTSLITVERFEQAIQLATLATQNGLHDLAFEAVRDALATGPPIIPIAVNNLANQRAMRINNGQATPDDPSPRVQLALGNLSTLWSRSDLPAAKVYEAFRDVVLPAKRPTEVFLYAKPITGPTDVRQPRSVLANLVEWAEKAGTLDDLAKRVEARATSPLAVVPAQVALARVAIARKDEAALIRALGQLGQGSKGATVASADLSSHAAIPALAFPKAADAAATLIESAARGSQNLQGMEEPARSYFLLLARTFAERNDAERARKAIRESNDRAQTAASRYAGDYSLYLRKMTLIQVAGIFSASGLLDDAVDNLGQFVDAPTSSNQDPSAATVVADILRRLRPRPAADRYALWKAWTFPTASRKSFRLVGGVPVALSPAIPEAFRAGAGPEVTGFPSNLSQLIDAAKESGKLDELAAEARKLADEKVENADILLVRVELAQGKDDRLKSIIKDRLVEIRKPQPPEPEQEAAPQNRRYVPPTPRGIGQEVATTSVAEALLLRGRLSPDEEEFLDDQRTLIRSQEFTEYLTSLQKDLRLKEALGADALASGLLPEGTGLVDWAMGAEPVQSRYGRSWLPVTYTTVDGVVASAGNGTTLVYQIPLAGTFSIEAEFDSLFNPIGYGARVAYPGGIDGSAVMSLGQTDRVSRPAVPHRQNGSNIARVDVSPQEVVYTVNGHLFHKEPPGAAPNPWLTIGAPYVTTALRSLKVTGAPEIPREVRLIAKDQLDGWRSPLGESLPPRRKTALTTDPYGYAVATSMIDYDWEAKDGILSGRMGSRQQPENNRISVNSWDVDLSPATVEDSLIQHYRALRDGDSISYAFLYEPGRTIVHPAIGSLAFLITPDGIKLRWTGLGPKNSLGLPADHAIKDTAAKQSATTIELKPGTWNTAVVTYKGGNISVAINGKPVHERPMEKASNRLFGFYHDKKHTGAKVKDVVLRGDWPKTLPADLLAPRGGPLSEKAILAQRLLQPAGNARAASLLLAKADTLAPKDLYSQLVPLCLPSEAFPSFGLPPMPDASDTKLIDVAREAGMLDDLADRLKKAPTRTEADIRTRKSLLARTLATQGKIEAARAELKQMLALAAEEAKKGERGRFTFYAARAAFDAKELAPDAMALLDANEQLWKAKGAPTPLAFAAARSMRSQILFARDPAAFGTPAGDPKAGPWAAVSPFLPGQKPSTIPYPRWSAKDGGWSAHADSNASQLYLRTPLAGDFEIQAQISTGVGREIGLAYGPIGFLPSKDLKRLDLRNYGRAGGVSSIEPAFKEVKDSVPLSLKVRGSSLTVSLDGRQVYEQTLPAERDPWLQLLTEQSSEGTVKDLKILGSPTIPEAIKLSARADLTGWLTDFTDTTAGQSLWKKQGDEIVGQKSDPVVDSDDPDNPYFNRYNNGNERPKLTSLPGSFLEDLLTYNRPLLEDGEVSYEFFHDPGAVMVHPSLGRSAFLIEKGGVKVHAITIGSTDKAPIDPQNATGNPAHRRGPAELPLKAKDWNTLSLKTAGDAVTIALNGVEVYAGPISKDNPRFFGLFHYHDQTEARVRNVLYKGDWPKTLPDGLRGGAKTTAAK